MISGPLVIEDQNLSHGWAKAFVEICGRGVTGIAPLVVSITGFQRGACVVEDSRIRALLDDSLRAKRLQPVRTVANTIFPRSLWNDRHDREELFRRYRRILPRLLRLPKNRYGTYFARMTGYQPAGVEVAVNQLEYVLQTRATGNMRRSAYQLAIVDPTRDHTGQRRRGFPCLQQVALTPTDGGLVVTGFYATQTLFERAYGNYVGLCDLGAFVAHEMNVDLIRVTCTAALAELDLTKGEARDLAESVACFLPSNEPVAVGVDEG